jgi:DNA-binding response OmpR family regulator
MSIHPLNPFDQLEKPPLTGERVLIVSGDERFAGALARYLEGEGWQAHVVTNERDAAMACGASEPDVIVVELEGHEIDGFELLAALRAPQRGIPSILLSRCVGADGVDRRVLRALGVVAVVRQPCRFGLLAGTLASIVRPPSALARARAEAERALPVEEYAS